MIAWHKGRVRRMIEDDEDYQEGEVRLSERDEAHPTVNYPALTGRMQPGDEVMVNTTAVDLNLGTGGKHFVACNFSRAADAGPGKGHIMKMRYSPMQLAVESCEEAASDAHALFKRQKTIQRMPVLLCELHSMVPVVAHLLKRSAPQRRLVYMMTDEGALPLALSDHIRLLRRRGSIDGTVTTGHAFGGTVEAVNAYTGLLAARHVLQADLTIVAMGPGQAGTGTVYGYSGIAQGEMVQRVSILGGIPIFVPRISFRDTRVRHFGVSHHSLTSLRDIALRSALVPFPIYGDDKDHKLEQAAAVIGQKHHVVFRKVASRERIERALSDYPKAIRTMNRDVRDDPAYFQNLAVAVEVALHCYDKLRFLTNPPAADAGNLLM